MNKKQKIACVLASMVWVPVVVLAQETLSSKAGDAQSIPEVIVRGDRFLVQLRMQLQDAEVTAYNIFNRFNDERRFNITCSDQALTGTGLKTLNCQPAFERMAKAGLARDYWESYRAFLDPYVLEYTPQITHQPPEAIIASQQKAFRSKMRQVAEEQPEFLEALVHYTELRERYEQARGMGSEQE